MEYLLYFLTLLGLFCSSFFIIAMFSGRLLDNIVVLSSSEEKEPAKGDEATIIINGQKLEAVVLDVFYEEGNLTRKIVLRSLR